MNGFAHLERVVAGKGAEPIAEKQPPLPSIDPNLRNHLDLGWEGQGWRPSDLFQIACCLAADWKTAEGGMIAIARQRWRAGFYANPFTNEPRRREAT